MLASRLLIKFASRGRDGPVSPLCSRNARPQKALVGRAQWGDSSGSSLGYRKRGTWKNYLWSLAAALPAEWRVLARRGWAGEKSGLSEQPARTDSRAVGL